MGLGACVYEEGFGPGIEKGTDFTIDDARANFEANGEELNLPSILFMSHGNVALHERHAATRSEHTHGPECDHESSLEVGAESSSNPVTQSATKSRVESHNAVEETASRLHLALTPEWDNAKSYRALIRYLEVVDAPVSMNVELPIRRYDFSAQDSITPSAITACVGQ